MDMIYEHAKGQSADYGSPVTVYGVWPQNIQDMWTQALIGSGYHPKAPVWVPTYDGPFLVHSENGQDAILNPYETPTEATTLELMKRYGASRFVPCKFDGAGDGSGNVSQAIVRWLAWPEFALKAGMLAAICSQNANNPDVAHSHCLTAIESARASGQQIPK